MKFMIDRIASPWGLTIGMDETSRFYYVFTF